MPPLCGRCFPKSIQFEYSQGCDRLDEQDRSGGSLKLNGTETIDRAQSRLRNAPLRRAVDSADTTPNATSVKAGHDGDPPTPTKGNDGEDDNAQANQYR